MGSEDTSVTVAEYQRVVKNNGVLEAELGRERQKGEGVYAENQRLKTQLQDQWNWFVALVKELANGAE